MITPDVPGLECLHAIQHDASCMQKLAVQLPDCIKGADRGCVGAQYPWQVTMN
jgi:hypothetical protein